jgi:hypothetical protein
MAHVTLGGLNLFGTEPDTGVKWTMDPLKGWGSPGSTIAPVQKTRQHGAWAGHAYYFPRHLPLTGIVQARTEAALTDAIARLTVACSLDDTLLTVVEDEVSHWCMVRREDEVLAPKVNPYMAVWSIQVIAVDPRKLGTPLTGSTGLPSSSGGLTVPFTVPFAINSTVVSGQVSLFNPGNETGPVTMRIDGPCTGPVITHVGSGLSLVFAASLTLGVGEFLLVDMEAHTAMAQGQSSRSNWITSRGWSGLEPGNNTFAFTAASSSAALLTVTGTPADQ